MRLPNFLLLGAPKCGTTALAQYLASHPDVFLSDPKEPHFFDAFYAKGIDAYLDDHFRGCKTETAIGEATPAYLAVPFVAERIHRHLPDARLVVTLRNPADRAFASWWMMHARGMEPLPFAEAIDAERRSLEAGNVLTGPDAIPLWRAHVEAVRQGEPIQVRMYLQAGWYAQHLERYYAFFGKHRVRVILTDDLNDDLEGVVRSLWSFLGVDPDAPLPVRGRVNEAVGTGSVALLRAGRATGLMRIRHLLPARGKNFLKRRLSRLGTRPTIDGATRGDLIREFAAHVDQLEPMVGRDLDAWRQ